MMKQAQKMQADIDAKKAQLATQEFTVEKQGVTLVVLGSRRIKTIDINEILVDPEDKDILEDLMVIAFNDAMDQIDEIEEDLAPKAPAGMGI